MSLAAIVLAAGSATRFGGGKLSARFLGEPVIAHAIRAARAAPVDRVVVVCPAELDIGAWDGRPPVEAVRLRSEALSTSLKAGIASVAADHAGAFVFLGDMPLVPHELGGALADGIGDRFAAMPLHAGKPAHPVLLSARAFPAIAALTGDHGAGQLLRGRDDVAFLDTADEGSVLDIDRAEDIARLEQIGRDGSAD